MIQITATGNLGRDAEVRHLNSGTPVCSFSLGASTGFGERKKTLWFSCSKFGRGAEGLAPYLTKGTKVVVVGELTEREWTNQQGETKKNLEINVSDLDFSGPKQGGGTPRAQNSPSQRAQTPPADAGFDDDIPF